MSVVRQDEHGLYIKTGGYLFRPQLSWYAKQQGYGWTRRPTGTTTASAGDKVKARHIAGTTTARVKTDAVPDGELWFGHGTYFADKADERGIVPTLPSVELWEPTGAKVCPGTWTNQLTGQTVGCVGPVQYGRDLCRLHLREKEGS